MSYTIVGVIGHIDHGKTSLVAALTGVDTDTHPEEKRRGITIDLGFASFNEGDHTFALVDAPGHQKYIGNLLAGVSGIDIGLLVVASDQGIQAQTLEHAAVLHSLGVSKLIAVISRIDLTDKPTRDELSEELDVFLADFGFEDIPKVAVSSVTGEGLDELRSELVRHARSTERTGTNQFRMPVDRVFTIEGRGCVVAGTPWSGTVSIGDHVQLAGSDQTARVRELEVHGESVTESRVGWRTAINLAGIPAADVVRGDELIEQGTHQPKQRFVVQLTMFRDAADLRCPATVHLHTATTACEARITGVKSVPSGETAVVVIDTETSIVTSYLQQCLFRKPYPVGSFAGARILAAVEPETRQTSRLLELGRELIDADAGKRLVAWIEFQGELNADPRWCEIQLGIAPERLPEIVDTVVTSGRVELLSDNRLISKRTIERIRSYILKLLTEQAELTEEAWLDQGAVAERVRSAGSISLVRHVTQELVREKKLVQVNKMVAVASEQTVLSKKQRARMERILEIYRGSRTPPTIKAIAQELETTIDSVSSLIRYATGQRVLVDLGNGFFMSDEMITEICSELQGLFAESPHRTVAEIRDHLGITRKHAIPLLEYCDKAGITVRDGDSRTAGPTIETMIAEQTLEHD